MKNFGGLMFLVGALVALSPLVHAADDALSCAKPLQEARNGMRLQTQLMMAGMMCQPYVDEANFYGKYLALVKDHEAVFTDYEQRLLDFYAVQGKVKPARSLDTYRTELANALSEVIATMTPAEFCQKTSEQIADIRGLSSEDLRAVTQLIPDRECTSVHAQR